MLLAACLGCAPTLTPIPPRDGDRPVPLPPTVPPSAPPADAPATPAGMPARVALSTGADTAALDATAAWEARLPNGTMLFRAGAGERWRTIAANSRLVLSGPDGREVSAGGIVLRPLDASGLVRVDGRRYRGEVSLAPSGEGILLVNTLGLEDYVRAAIACASAAACSAAGRFPISSGTTPRT